MFELRGLTASSPIGFLAALGFLRVIATDRKRDVRLGWKQNYAVITGIDPDKAIEELIINMEDRDSSPEFNWADSARKISPDEYRIACENMQDNHRALGFMAGWATDAVLRDGKISVTRFDMTSGNQKLLKNLRKMATQLTKAHFETALYGGPYEDQPSFGLDPATVRTHAHEPKAPTKSSPLGKPGLIWLAFESIPLHPVTPASPTRSQTAGWTTSPESGYVWPLWHGYLTVEEVQQLRSMPLECLADRPGVTEIWFSKYGSSGKYGMLLPAQREL